MNVKERINSQVKKGEKFKRLMSQKSWTDEELIELIETLSLLVHAQSGFVSVGAKSSLSIFELMALARGL